MSKSSVWKRDHDLHLVSDDESPIKLKKNSNSSSVKHKNKRSESRSRSRSHSQSKKNKKHKKSQKQLPPPKSGNPYISLNSGIGVTATDEDKKEASEADEIIRRLNEKIQLQRLKVLKGDLKEKKLIAGKSRKLKK